MADREYKPLRTYSEITFTDDSVIKSCALPNTMTRETAPDLDVFLHQQLFHALVDRFNIPGILPLDQNSSSYDSNPTLSDTRRINLGFRRATGESLYMLTKQPLRAHDVVRVIHATTRTLRILQETIETAYPGQTFGGHKDLKPDCLFINGTITILDWQTYDITPAVPALKRYMFTPDYSSIEHLLTYETGVLASDVVSMAKILLHGILGDRGYPSIHSTVTKKETTEPPQQTHPTTISGSEMSCLHAIQDHANYSIGIIDSLLSGLMTEANTQFCHSRIHPACVDAQPDVLHLIRDVLYRDVKTALKPDVYKRMSIEEFAERLAALDPLYPKVSDQVCIPRAFRPDAIAATSGTMTVPTQEVR